VVAVNSRVALKYIWSNGFRCWTKRTETFMRFPIAICLSKLRVPKGHG